MIIPIVHALEITTKYAIHPYAHKSKLYYNAVKDTLHPNTVCHHDGKSQFHLLLGCLP